MVVLDQGRGPDARRWSTGTCPRSEVPDGLLVGTADIRGHFVDTAVLLAVDDDLPVCSLEGCPPTRCTLQRREHFIATCLLQGLEHPVVLRPYVGGHRLDAVIFGTVEHDLQAHAVKVGWAGRRGQEPLAGRAGAARPAR